MPEDTTNPTTQLRHDEVSASPTCSLTNALKQIEEIQRELRYQCWHNCQWQNEHGDHDSSDKHLPPAGWKPWQHRGNCGHDHVGKDLTKILKENAVSSRQADSEPRNT